MSRAFVKESDDAGELLPELAISTHPNFVTPAGLAQIEARVAGLETEALAARAANDRPLLARIERDARYWRQRRSTARVVPLPVEVPDVVRFGVAVTLRFDDGAERTFRLVGEDEANPARGLLSFVAPLARALMGKAAGESVEVAERAAEIVSVAC